MPTLTSAADAHVDAPADVVLHVLRDFDGHHRRILPPAFSDFEILHGGYGDGTMTSFKLKLGGRTTAGRTLATETEPGTIREQIIGRDMVTEFRVAPEGDGSRVTISTRWTPAGGLSGALERLFAPSMLRKVYVEELALLAGYAPTLTPEASAPETSAAANPGPA
ncbi:MAG TPA: SRPBCC family protein [Candidatus Limnocylindrales bacterium]